MREKFIEELMLLENYQNNPSKDIIIVVRDCLKYTKDCIESIYKYTKNFNLFIWDNGSGYETRDYLESLKDIYLVRSSANVGFIIPNNELIKLGISEYVILLNNDTLVEDNWDRLMTAYLEQHPDVKAIGYRGGLMNENGVGIANVSGEEIDYVSGWCLCFARKTYEYYGLFNNELSFAYGEDADFSLRLKERGHRIYALYSPYVSHFGNTTIKSLVEKEVVPINFEKNMAWLRGRWGHYLQNERILCKTS